MEHITEVLSNLEFSEERFPVPHTFISRLKEYFPDIATEPRFKVILHRVLWDDQWWQYTCEDYETWDDFECAFINYYWSETIQEKWEDIINNGLYSYNHGDKRIYAMKLFRIGRQLGFGERNLVNRLLRHFHINAQCFLTVGPVNSIASLIKLIEASDNFHRNPGQQRQPHGEQQADPSVEIFWENPRQQGNMAKMELLPAENIREENMQLLEDDPLDVPEVSGVAGPHISQTGELTDSDSEKIDEGVLDIISFEEIPIPNSIAQHQTSIIPADHSKTQSHSSLGSPRTKLKSFTEWTNKSPIEAYNLNFQVGHLRILTPPVINSKPAAASNFSSMVMSIPAVNNLQGDICTDEVFPGVHWVWDPGGTWSGFSLHRCTVALRQHCAVMEQRGKQIYFLDQSHIGPD
uniref:Activity-regulated cytoskeleton-associated protein n=1 Tax=Lygus hesperus TaxID=30085 RepID=A0A0A9X6T4_LYGHE